MNKNRKQKEKDDILRLDENGLTKQSSQLVRQLADSAAQPLGQFCFCFGQAVVAATD